MEGVVKAQAKLVGHALDATIAETLEMEARVAELAERIRANREYIKDAMRKRKLRRYETHAGDEAILYECEQYEWDLRKLARVLLPQELDAMCPRTPDGARLRKLMEADGSRAAGLRRCAQVAVSRRLVLRPGREIGDVVGARARKSGMEVA